VNAAPYKQPSRPTVPAAPGTPPAMSARPPDKLPAETKPPSVAVEEAQSNDEPGYGHGV
jgi:hypothetical protein